MKARNTASIQGFALEAALRNIVSATLGFGRVNELCSQKGNRCTKKTKGFTPNNPYSGKYLRRNFIEGV